MAEDLADLKYEYEKAMRVKASLEKNYERRKKLNLLDENAEDDLKDDIASVVRQIEDLKRKVRALESQKARSRTIAESGDRAPWEE